MLVFRSRDAASLRVGAQGVRLVLLGGATGGEPRHVWWTFVAASKESTEAAAEAWRQGDRENGRFHLPPVDDREFVPLP